MNYHEARTLLTTRRLRIELVEEVQPETDEDGNVSPDSRRRAPSSPRSPTEDTQVPAGTVINVTVMGGEGWEDPNKPIQVEIQFDLPQGDGVVHVQTYVDGVETGYGDPDLSKQSTWDHPPNRPRRFQGGDLYRRGALQDL